MPPLEIVTGAYDPSYEPPVPQYEPEKKGLNIFTDNVANNNPSGRGRCLMHVTSFPPRGQNRRPFLGRGMSTENLMKELSENCTKKNISELWI